MKLGRRRDEDASIEDDEVDDLPEELGAGKGRPTPKRRDAVGKRGPVSAPKTRKEAMARQRQLAKSQKAARSTPAAQLTPAQRRQLMKAGDPSVLPKRDQGPTRKLARDFVDSRRMASNYLLILFPLIILGTWVPFVQIIVAAAFVGFLSEWYFVGRRIRRLAIERNGSADGTNFGLGFYAGSRAYLPRRWRLPAPQVSLGDQL